MRINKLFSDCGNVYLTAPLIVNIQLNNYCPLSCPFCFMNFGEKAEISMKLLQKYFMELSVLGCRTITFGQGEPMVSSKIYDAVKMAHSHGFRVKIATSGAGCTYNKLRRLYEYGLNELSISINSFEKTINSKSRDGFDLAIVAMKTAIAVGIPFKVTYVAQEETMPHFEDYAQHAASLGATGISILREKVSATGNIENYTYGTLKHLAEQINKSPIPVEIEECFCELKVLITNREKAPLQGCAAGRAMMAITVSGEFMPCPHLYSKRESYSSLSTYWKSSPILANLRNICLNTPPCNKCKNVMRCSSCQAIYPDNRNDYYDNRKECPVYVSI